MKKIGIILIAFLLTACAGCTQVTPDDGTTQPSTVTTTAPQQTVPPTTLPPETTVPVETTVPIETTAPVETTVPTTTPVDPNALTSEEIEALEAVYTTHESLTYSFPRNWYNATLLQEFDSLENLDVNDFFGHPGAVIPVENYELTDAEIDFLMTFKHMPGVFRTGTSVYRLPRTDAEFLLKWYFDLELENADMTEVYWEETDCYYYSLEPGAVLAFDVLEAKYIDDDLIWFRYRDARSGSRPEYEAVIKVYRERFVLVSNMPVE
jgi:hypothetical protein